MVKYRRKSVNKKRKTNENRNKNKNKNNTNRKRTKKSKRIIKIKRGGGGSESKISFVYITAEWCHYCKILKPIIEDMKTKLDSINFISVDSETMEEQFKEIKEKYNVDIKKPDGFPSLGKIVSGSYIEYPNDKPRDIGSLIQFLS
jgi:thiol-disulfide isomerase/thioredoxin